MKKIFSKTKLVNFIPFRFFFFVIIGFSYNSCKAQILYASLYNSGLIKINISSCTETVIGYTDSVLVDIAICPDSKLYGTDGRYLYEIDTSNAILTTIGQQNTVALSNNLVCDKSGNLLSIGYNDSLYQINRFTGQYLGIGQLDVNYYSAGDLTFYNDTLYLSACGDYLIKIILPNCSTQNMGMMNAQNIWGVNTICINGNQIMIASGGTATHSNLYQVNPNNANLNLLCNTVTHNLIYGAASINDYNDEFGCKTMDIMPSHLNTKMIDVYPNPTYDFVNVTTDNNTSSEIIVYGISSTKIYQIKFVKFVSINMRDIPKGIYFYEIRNNQEIKRGKIIKE